MTNFNFEIQKLFFEKLNTIDYLKNNSIKIYSSVPSNAQIPYIKFSNISISSGGNLSQNSREFTFILNVITNEKSTQKIMEILENIHNDLPNKIIGSTDSLGKVQIISILDCNYSIEEIISENIWNGKFSIKLIGKKIS